MRNRAFGDPLRLERASIYIVLPFRFIHFHNRIFCRTVQRMQAQIRDRIGATLSYNDALDNVTPSFSSDARFQQPMLIIPSCGNFTQMGIIQVLPGCI